MKKSPLVIGILLISLLLSSSILSSPRSVQPILADDSTNNSTEIATSQEKQSNDSEAQVKDEMPKNYYDQWTSPRSTKSQRKVNHAPKADAGTDLIVISGNKVILNGENILILMGTIWLLLWH